MSDEPQETLKEAQAKYVRSLRDEADSLAAQWGVDDASHPYNRLGFGDQQLFTSWVDFVEKVARPLVLNDVEDEDEEQRLMALFRTVSPYYLCTSLNMARGTIERLRAELKELKGDAS